MTSHERFPKTTFDQMLRWRLNRRQIVRQSSVLGLTLPAASALRTVPSRAAGATALGATAPVVGSTSRVARAAQAPQGELIVAVPADTYTTDPDLWTSGIGMYTISMNIFEPLVTMSSTYELQPMLAESWEMVDDLTWRLTLRPDVIFHDGTPLTTEAIPNWLDRLNRVGFSAYFSIADVELIDDRTFEINTTAPNFRLVEQLASNYEFLEAPGTDLTKERVGTGPFREVEYVPHDHYTVEAFDGYWGDPAKLARLTYRFIPDPTTRVLALQAGEVHISSRIPRESTEQVTASGDLRIVTSPTSGYEALMINHRGAEPYDLTQELAVREAIAYGIDKQAIIDGVWFGNAELSPTMVPAAMLGEHAALVQGPMFDPERSRRVLDEAGWVVGADGIRERDGRTLTVTLINGFPTPEDHGAMPELVQAQLREVGIDVELVQTSDLGSYDARLETGEGNLWAETSTQYNAAPCALPHELLVIYEPYTAMFGPSEETVAAINQCVAAPTTDEALAAIAEALHRLVDEEFVLIPIAATFAIYGVAGNVEGFEPHSVFGLQYWNSVSLAG